MNLIILINAIFLLAILIEGAFSSGNKILTKKETLISNLFRYLPLVIMGAFSSTRELSLQEIQLGLFFSIPFCIVGYWIVDRKTWTKVPRKVLVFLGFYILIIILNGLTF